MKKLILMLTVCLFAVAGNVSAQKVKEAPKPKSKKVLATGKVILQAVDGKETVQLVRQGDTFSELLFTDAAGKKTSLVPAQRVIPGAPGADCDSRSRFSTLITPQTRSAWLFAKASRLDPIILH